MKIANEENRFRNIQYGALFSLLLIAAVGGIVRLHEYVENTHYSDRALQEAFGSNREGLEKYLALRGLERAELEVNIKARSESLRAYWSDDKIYFCCASVVSSEIDLYESNVSTKGYVYSDRELTPLVSSLDQLPYGEYYRRVDGNWYIYVNNGISKPE